MRVFNVKLSFFVVLFSFPLETSGLSDPIPHPVYEMDFRISTYFKSGGSHVTEAHMVRQSQRVRIEPEPGNEEVHIFDYEEKIFYRIFTEEKIFFTYPISQREIARAYQQGIIFDSGTSSSPKLKIKLKETEFHGHPSILYLIGKEIPSLSRREEVPPLIHYSFVWEAQDLSAMPVKIADRAKDGTTTVIEFLNIEKKEPNPSLFSPPEGFLHLSPF